MYISIQDFAERAGISRQKVYRLVRSGQIPDNFVTESGQRKMLNETALSLPCLSGADNSGQKTDKNGQQADNLADTLQETVKVLTEQLKQKDDQINKLTELLQQKEEANRLIIETLNRSQALHAGTIQTELLKAPETKETPEAAPITDEQAPKTERTGIFSRIFKRH